MILREMLTTLYHPASTELKERAKYVKVQLARRWRWTDECSGLDDGVRQGKPQPFAGLKPKLSGREHFCPNGEAGFIHSWECKPVTLEFCPDIHRPGPPFLSVNNPVEFVYEEPSVEGFDVESMRVREGGHG